MLNKILKYLRIINKKTFNIQLLLIITSIRAKFQILIFHLCPKLVTLLSIKTARLPNKEERFSLNKTEFDEFKKINKQKFKFDTSDLFIRAKKYNYKDFKRYKNIFLLNPFYTKNETAKFLPASQKKLLIIKKKNIFYVTADHTFLDEYLKNELNIVFIQTWKKDGKKLFISKGETKSRKKFLKYCKKSKNSYLLDVHFETNCKTMYCNSAIIAALTFAKLTKKLRIHNWNYYMNSSPANYGYFKTINLLYPLKFRIKNNVFLEMSLWQWVFAYRLSKLKNVKINGFINGILNKKAITTRLLKIFYKNN